MRKLPDGITRGLIIKKNWLDMIFDGGKVWEILGTDTKTRGKIALIESGSGMVVGDCELTTSWPMCIDDRRRIDLHCIKNWNETVKYKVPHAWVMHYAKRYNKPIPYKHPQGAVIWVNLEGRVWK